MALSQPKGDLRVRRLSLMQNRADLSGAWLVRVCQVAWDPFDACLREWSFGQPWGFNMTCLQCGLFIEFIPWLTGIELGKFHLLGEQTISASFSSLADVAGMHTVTCCTTGPTYYLVS